MIIRTLGMRLLILIILSAMGVFGEQNDDAEDMSYGRPNGRFYLARTPQARIDILYGIEQGISLLVDEAIVSEATGKRFMVKGFRFSELKSQIDQFYEDKANLRIPISYAYLWAVRRASGEPAAELEGLLTALRRRFLLK